MKIQNSGDQVPRKREYGNGRSDLAIQFSNGLGCITAQFYIFRSTSYFSIVLRRYGMLRSLNKRHREEFSVPFILLSFIV